MTNTTNETTFLVDEQTGGGGGGGGGGLEQQTKIGEEEATKKDHHQNDLQMGKGTTFKSSANDAKDEMTKFKVYTKTGDDGTSSLYNLERRKKSDLTFEALGDCDETNVAVGIARVHARDFFLFNTTNNNSDATTSAETIENAMLNNPTIFIRNEDGSFSLADKLEKKKETKKNADGTSDINCFDEDVLPHLEIIQSRLLDVGSAIATPMTSEKTKDGMKMRCRFDESHVDAIESWIDAYEEELPALTNFLCPGGTKFAAFLHQARAICRRCERKVQPMVESGDVEKSVGMYLNRLSDYLFVAARVANHRVGVEDVSYKKA
jgi:ATP:cob(I)alamin adenosyltransferase